MDSLRWDFGDGNTSTAQSPTHFYELVGRYDVMLSAVGPGGEDEVLIRGAVTVTPGPVVSLVISPSDAILSVLESAQFTAVARDEFGNDVSVVLDWVIIGEGGSIDKDGGFTAGTQAGAFPSAVKASFRKDQLELTSLASVTIEPGALSRVVVQPNEIALGIGNVHHFTFSAFDEFGNEIVDVLSSWTALNGVGVVDTDGRVTAGTKAGLYLDSVRLDVVKGLERASFSADVAIQPDPLETIIVEPSFTVIEVGATQQFQANGSDQFGNGISGLAMLWEATGGRITQKGFFTVGELPGRYVVNVSATLGDRKATGSATAIVPFEIIIFGDLTKWTQGWQSTNHTTSLKVTDDGLEFFSVGNDPQIQGPPMDFPKGEPILITIRMKSDANTDGRIFYSRPGAPPSGTRFTVNPDGEWHQYDILIPPLGPLTTFRIDPASTSGKISIAWIRVALSAEGLFAK